MKHRIIFLGAGLFSALFVSQVVTADVPATIVPTDYVVLPAVGQYGRLPLQRDPVEAALVTGNWKNPSVGDTVTAAEGRSQTWQSATADDGTLDTNSIRGGYAFTTFNSPADAAMLLEASGHATVYVNGEPHAGDPYNLGWLRLPVRLKKGSNTLLFHLASNRLTARLTTPTDAVLFADADRTLPTVLRDNPKPMWAAIPVINTTGQMLNDVRVVCRTAGDESRTTTIGRIPPLAVRKVAFEVPAVKDPKDREISFEVVLAHGDDYRPLVRTELILRVVDATDVNVRTFRSRIDGSVQPYAVRPADMSSATAPPRQLPGVLVTLHDAGVACVEQAERFTSLDWAHVVAPQGRRPYGFDWEAWSRIDALEALADARRHYANNPRHTYLTGRGMGGHGVWHLAATYPDQFAAIGAADSWVSFWSYGGGMPSFDHPDAIEDMILRSYAPSETVKLLRNLAHTGVFVLHDPAADDVPVEQARFLRQELADFHPNFVYHEAPVAGADRSSAAEQPTDRARMFDFFQHCERPEPNQIASVDFTTADPAISSSCDFVVIDAQLEQLVPSQVEMHFDSAAHALVGTTANVARLGIRPEGSSNQPLTITLDGQLIATPNATGDDGTLWFVQASGRWMAARPPLPSHKNARRNGTFTAAFGQRVALVYGTQGSDQENRWAEAKARFDAETFYYRAGGALDVLPDSLFDPKESPDRNVILYGNADTNKAWAALLSDCPVDVRRGRVAAGDNSQVGDDLAVVMVRPRADSQTALVGVVGGTGPIGMRLTDRLRWFVSGITYPDLILFGSNVLTEGISDIRAWGYFGPDWGLDDAEIAWRDAAL